MDRANRHLKGLIEQRLMLPAEGVGIPLGERQVLVGQLQQCRRFLDRRRNAHVVSK